ncbi:MAG: cache domain-containing protein [Selenomonadaceae bacterium]|nr:cache domain-containing protein [Selenomonadaceae bacterium]
MSLKNKAILAVTAIVVVACVLMGVIGYIRVEDAFAKALELKAESNVQSLSEILNYRYQGDWNLRDGVLYKGETKMEGADQIVDSLSQICEGKVTIFNGDVRVSTTVKDASGKRQVGTKGSPLVTQVVIAKGKPFLGKALVVGEEHYAAYQPLNDATGKTIGMLFVGVSMHEMDSVTNDFILTTIIGVIAVVLVCIFLSNYFIGQMIEKLDSVVKSMHQVAEGNLRIPDLNVVTDDEIGALANSLNNMKFKLKHLLTRILEYSARVAASSKDLNEGTQQTHDSINSVVQSMSVLAHGTAEQEQTIVALEEKINDMFEKMDSLSETALQMQEVANDSTANAAEGKKRVDAAIAMMKKIEEQVNSSAKVVGELGKRSDEIGQIVETISGIAGQTNLLALNAAIEAARAGEQGRGFAVVAEEVRKLAEQSAEAATNIANLIATIQADTESAVEAIDQGYHGVKEGTQAVVETGEAFAGIEEQSNRLTANVEKSLADIAAVYMSNGEITTAVGRVREIANKSSENAVSVNAVTQEQTASMQEVAHASQKLTELAHEMHDEVNTFKL